jgi:ABC-type dipeptide/oligopeptide/nickel transport system permease component
MELSVAAGLIAVWLGLWMGTYAGARRNVSPIT